MFRRTETESQTGWERKKLFLCETDGTVAGSDSDSDSAHSCQTLALKSNSDPPGNSSVYPTALAVDDEARLDGQLESLQLAAMFLCGMGVSKIVTNGDGKV